MRCCRYSVTAEAALLHKFEWPNNDDIPFEMVWQTHKLWTQMIILKSLSHFRCFCHNGIRNIFSISSWVSWIRMSRLLHTPPELAYVKAYFVANGYDTVKLANIILCIINVDNDLSWIWSRLVAGKWVASQEYSHFGIDLNCVPVPAYIYRCFVHQISSIRLSMQKF